MLEVLRYIALNALNTVQKFKAMSKMLKIDKVHLTGCNAMYVEDVEDRSNTPKGCNAMYVEDVKDISNTPKGCNAMYVKEVKDGKRTYTHILAHNFLNT